MAYTKDIQSPVHLKDLVNQERNNEKEQQAQPAVNKYEEALKLYNTDIDDQEVKEAVKKLIAEKVPENDTLEVKKFLMGSVELTSLHPRTDREGEPFRRDVSGPSPCSNYLRLSLLRRHRQPKSGSRRR